MRRVVAGLVIAAVGLIAGDASARGCREVSDVVGLERCRIFGGRWAREATLPLVFELTHGLVFIDPKRRTIEGNFGKGRSGSFSYPGGLVGHDLSAWVEGMRLSYAFQPWIYAGLEMALGPGIVTLPAVRTSTGPTYRASGLDAMAMRGGLVTGLRLPLGFVSLRGEAFFGADALDISQTATRQGVAQRGMVHLDSWRIEPRFAFDVWATPWMTLSAYGGFDTVHLGDHLGGLSVAFHGRNYDDGFSF
jgi:hypothetical protein